MSEFRIVTDGACDLPPDWCAAHHITVLPMYYSLASAMPEAFPGKGNFLTEEFYRLLQEGTLVRTSAPSIEDCKALMRPILAEGKDILYTGLSSQLSGTFNVVRLSVMELKEEFPERRMLVIDSKCASLGLGMLVQMLAEQCEVGLEEAGIYCTQMRSRIRHLFTVGDLMYLKRGGRISSGAAVVGTMLQIMPLLHITPEGTLESYGKVRGRKTVLRTLADQTGEAMQPDTSIIVAHCNAEEDAQFIRECLRRKFGIRKVTISQIGPVIGAHAGPGAVGVFSIMKA